MATTELARINYAVNTIIEQASSAIGLSKRSAMALAIIAADRDPDLVIRGEQIMTNQGLQDRFVRHKISTEASAKKDSSNAKSELLENGYIRVIGRVSVTSVRLSSAWV